MLEGQDVEIDAGISKLEEASILIIADIRYEGLHITVQDDKGGKYGVIFIPSGGVRE